MQSKLARKRKKHTAYLAYAATQKAAREIRRKANPALTSILDKTNYLRQKYGMSLASLEAMLIAQKHRCALCGDMFGEPVKLRPALDHNHGTSIIRSLLHQQCNLWLGIVENRKFCELAEQYLIKHKEV